MKKYFLLSRKLNIRYSDTTVEGFGGLQAIPQGVTVRKFDEKENLRTPEGRGPYGQDSARAKRVPILFLAIFFLILTGLLADSKDWYIIKSTHFLIYYKNVSAGFLDDLIEKAEEYYNKIADDLGLRRYNFWLWDNRAKIYIYEDAQSYREATGQPSWSGGCALIKDKIIYTFPYAKDFFETTLPHELGHIIFREFVGFDNNAVPLWLDEGVASFQEALRYSTANRLVKEAIDKGTFINLEDLSRLNPQVMQDKALVSLFYAESISIVDCLIKEFGPDNFVLFCQALRDKRDLWKAINYAYPFNNMQELEEYWQKYILKIGK